MAPEKVEQGKVEEEKSKGKKKRSSKKLLILVAVIVLVVLVGGGYLAMRMGLVAGGLGGLTSPRATGEEVQKAPDYTFEFSEILVNLSDDQRRFLSIKFYVGFDESKLEEELEQRMPEIRDSVLSVLWDKTAEEVNEPGGKERLRGEIKDVVNDLLISGEITGVYFWHVMIQ